MRPFVVVEVNGAGDGCDDLADARKVHPFEKLVLHRVVDTFSLGIVTVIIN